MPTEVEVTYMVTLRVPVSLAFDPGEKIPEGRELKELLAANLEEWTVAAFECGAGTVANYIDQVEQIIPSVESAQGSH